MNNRKISLSLIFSLLVSLSIGQIHLPALVSDGMILQRSTATRIWGWAGPGEELSVTFRDSVYGYTADQNGKWEIMLNIPDAGGPDSMILSGKNKIVLNDILVGDVWLCSGQSNMELTMERAAPIYTEIIENCYNRSIRQFEVPDRYNFKEARDDLDGGKWTVVDPVSILKFSAVAYFYARELNERYQIPVGLINASLGGSPAQAWVCEETLKSFPKYYEELQRFKSDSLIKAIETADRHTRNEWYNELYRKDLGNKDTKGPWNREDLNDKKWEVMQVPGYWNEAFPGDKNGVFWFRKNFEVPDSIAGKEAALLLGRIVDADSVYVNGVFIGTTSYKYPPRRYKIPENILHKGKNNITVRVINSGGKGGFVPDKPYTVSRDKWQLDLTGDWYFRKGADMEPLPGSTTVRWKPGGLYNAMINPLTKYNIKGIVWYQGESNASKYDEYRKLFPQLIMCWRKAWQNDMLPFIYVQLPNYMEATAEPRYSEWAFLREAQSEALSLPNTAMAVAIDLGEWNDIHPLNKKDVSYRIALKARAMVYGEKNLITGGPEFSKVEFKGDTAVVYFSRLGGGLVTKGNAIPEGFSLMGKDGQFHRAEARIDGEEVRVWCKGIDFPVAIRYAWDDNPDKANLCNTEGLPVAPFRSDNLGR